MSAFDEVSAVDPSATWQRLCGTPRFSPLSEDGRFLSPCCQELAVAVPAAVLYLVSAAFCMDGALRQPAEVSRPAAGRRLITARLWLSLLMAAAAATRLVVFAVLTERWWAAAALAPVLLTFAWLAAALVAAAVRSRLPCGSRGPLPLLLTELLLLGVGGVQLAGSLLQYRLSGAALPLAQLCLDAVYLAAGVLRLSTQLPQYPAETEPTSDHAPLLTTTTSTPPLGELGAAEDGAGWFSRLTFWWAQPLMRRGRQRLLNDVSDLHTLPAALSTDRVDGRFTACLRRRAAALRVRVCADREPDRLLPPAPEPQPPQVRH